VPFMTRIPSDLARFGLKVELVPGWATRGSSSFAPACVVDHWTAGPRGTTKRPSLDVVINGRPGIEGPLCNIYLARDGTCVVGAAGRANHAGAGGFRGLVGNSAAYGIEAESGGDGDWTSEMLGAYPRLNAALLSGLGRDASWVCGHNEWAPTRKVDIRDIIATVRASTAKVLTSPTPLEDDMPLTNDDVARVASRVLDIDLGGGTLADFVRANNKGGPLPEAVWRQPVFRPDTDPLPAGELLGWTDRAASIAANTAGALSGQVAGLTEALRQLAAAPGQDVDLAAIEAAAERGVAKGIEAIDVTVRRAGD
jgi:hypothetical protein